MTDQAWKYGVEVTGVDEALAKLNALRASFAQNIEQTKTAASATGEVASADQRMLSTMSGVANAIEQQNAAQKKLNEALKEHGAATADSTVKIQQFGSTIGLAARGVGEFSPALGQMVSVLGQAAGSVGAMEAALGPMGIAIGVATTAFTLIDAAISNFGDQQHDTAEQMHREILPTFDELIAKANQAQAALSLRTRVQSGRGSVEEQQGFTAEAEAYARQERDRMNAARAHGDDAEGDRLEQEFHRAQEVVTYREQLERQSEARMSAQRADDAARELQDRQRRELGYEIELAGGVPGGRGGGGGGRGAGASADAANPKADALALIMKQAAAQRALDDAELAGRQKIQQATELAAQAERDERQSRITEEKRGYEVALEHERALAEAKKARIREVEALSRAAHERDMRQQQELLAAISSMAQTTSGFFNLIADSEGKSAKAQKEASIIRLVGQGTNEVVNSAIDFATAIGSTVENPVLAATKYLSGGLHAANAVRAFELAGKGGEAAAAPSSGAGAASSQTSGVPSRFDAGARPGGTGGSGTVVINVGTFPVSTDVQVGDAVLRALQAHARTNGATFQRAA